MERWRIHVQYKLHAMMYVIPSFSVVSLSDIVLILSDSVEVICQCLLLNAKSHITRDRDTILTSHRNDAATIVGHNTLQNTKQEMGTRRENVRVRWAIAG